MVTLPCMHLPGKGLTLAQTEAAMKECTITIDDFAHLHVAIPITFFAEGEMSEVGETQNKITFHISK